MESTKCLLVLLASVLVVCVSAGKDEEDTRPFCYRNFTEAEVKEKEESWKKCKGTLTEDEKKDKKGSFPKMVCCFMKEKQLVKDDGSVDFDALTTKIDEFAVNDYKQPLKDLVTECSPNSKCEDYVKCVHEKKDTLPCKCHKKCKKGKKDEDKDEEADVPA